MDLKTTNLMRSEAGTRNGLKNDKFDEVWPPRRRLEHEMDLKTTNLMRSEAGTRNGPKNDKFDEV